MKRFETDVFERWREAMAGGYQVVPNQLLRLQHKLDLTSHQVVILLNLSMHWWKKKDLPFPRPSIIANRMGVSLRTVERELKGLCEMGLVKKKRLPKNVSSRGYTVAYDLGGLVAKLASLTPPEAKSGKLAHRIRQLKELPSEPHHRVEVNR